MTQSLARTYTVREFNRDPSAVARSALRWGDVVVTSRGEPWLVVVDADLYQTVSRAEPATNLSESLQLLDPVDDAALGDPPRATWRAKRQAPL
jgi:prevent-host-death family protein